MIFMALSDLQITSFFLLLYLKGELSTSFRAKFSILYLFKACNRDISFAHLHTATNVVYHSQLQRRYLGVKTMYQKYAMLALSLLGICIDFQYHIDGLVQDWSKSISNTLELLQSCTKPSYYENISVLVFSKINSSPPSATCMRQWTESALVQVMACPLLKISHYLKQCWLHINGTLRNKLQWNLDHNTILFIHENGFENIVCTLAAIFPGGDDLTLVSYADGKCFHGAGETIHASPFLYITELQPKIQCLASRSNCFT